MSTAVLPEPIAQLQRRLDQIRSTQPRGKKLPDSVWQAAVELAREHGVYSVAHPLRLDYAGLKKRLGSGRVQIWQSPYHNSSPCPNSYGSRRQLLSLLRLQVAYE
jgi:hypothetical protein